MHWTPVEQEMPRMCEQVLIETADGQLVVATYRPEFRCPWIVEICRADDGSMVCFFAQISEVTAWANIEVRE